MVKYTRRVEIWELGQHRFVFQAKGNAILLCARKMNLTKLTLRVSVLRSRTLSPYFDTEPALWITKCFLRDQIRQWANKKH